ncbi:hypothetical protein CI610_03218 [invertebrate metagenome]|uniref:Zinc-binding loop region of homing endonuclease domain-containing protein n=1 Tax=invertebrate metagenome TaxID=1711999 RepID=A0A2H9T3Q0_9ZZZZ
MEDFYELYKWKLSENSVICPENGTCRLWTGPLTKTGKYGIISFKDPVDSKWKKKHAHRLAVIVHFQNLGLSSDLDCSHLCHNSLCINVDHISLEPHFINNNRQYCLNSNICHGHVGFRDCLLNLKI